MNNLLMIQSLLKETGSKYSKTEAQNLVELKIHNQGFIRLSLFDPQNNTLEVFANPKEIS